MVRLVCRGREPGEACPSLHWPLTRPELQALTSAGRVIGEILANEEL